MSWEECCLISSTITPSTAKFKRLVCCVCICSVTHAFYNCFCILLNNGNNTSKFTSWFTRQKIFLFIEVNNSCMHLCRRTTINLVSFRPPIEMEVRLRRRWNSAWRVFCKEKLSLSGLVSAKFCRLIKLHVVNGS